MQSIPERLRELADEIERKQTPQQPFMDQADEALYLQPPPQASLEFYNSLSEEIHEIYQHKNTKSSLSEVNNLLTVRVSDFILSKERGKLFDVTSDRQEYTVK